MRVVLQRVSRAAVRVEGETVGAIGNGLLLLIGFAEGDSSAESEWMAGKLVGLRVFNDADGKMNLSLEETEGEILAVSQFTLYGDARKGRRPSYAKAASPEAAASLYRDFVALLQTRAPGRVSEGVFGAMMEVELVNDGPVTLLLEKNSGLEGRELEWS